MSAIRSQGIASRDPQRRRRGKVEFLDTDKIHRMKLVKVEKFRVPGLRIPSILLKNPQPIRGGRGSRRYRRTARKMSRWRESR